jgi:hypothetical protein
MPLETIKLFGGDCDYIFRGGTQGPALSRNYGLALVETPFVMFLDDDDSLMMNYFDSLVPLIKKSVSPINFTNFYFCYEDRESDSFSDKTELSYVSLVNITKANIYTINSIPNSCLVYDAKFLSDKKFTSSVDIYEDWIFLLDCLQHSELNHLPCAGVVIHKTKDSEGLNSRRGNSRNDLILPVTLQIYKTYPVDYAGKVARQAFFAARGILLDLSFF